MIRTTKRYVNPLLWGIVGWCIAALGNVIATDLAQYWHPIIHLDEILVAIAFAGLRWMHDELRFEQIFASRTLERKVRDSLQVLRYSTDDAAKTQAVDTVVKALEEHRPVHPDFPSTLQ